MRYTVYVAVLAFLMLVSRSTDLRAEVITFELDSSLSSISLSGLFKNSFGEVLAMTEQAPGTLTAHLGGSAILDDSSGSKVLTVFSDAIPLSGEYLPAQKGEAYQIPTQADLAGRVVNPDPSGQGLYTARNITLGLLSGPIVPDSLGKFSASNILAALTWDQSFSTTDLGGGGIISYPTNPLPSLNLSSASGSLERIGNQLVLTVPIELPWRRISPYSSKLIPVSGILSGQIVGVATVPECHSLVLLLSASCILIAGRKVSRAR